jgi:hypothetical protein
MLSDHRAVSRRFAVLLAACAALLAGPTRADDPARLRLAALVEQGELLLEEFAGLQPTIERLRVEGERLTDSEATLRTELVGLEREIAAYNEAASALIEAARQHRARCPQLSEDSKLIEQCNAGGAELMNRYAVLEQQRAELSGRQQTLNQRIERHNADRLAWHADKRDNGPRIDSNESEANRWVGSARGFMLSEPFAALTTEAGGPASCTDLRLSEATAYHGTQGLKALHVCLQSVRAGLR